ncbi:28S ribosomal protein S23, mitochondrial isoform X2 [Polyodon spathula]|uniref:28S ribosomal protein S23, mitochondrial isoform X2 n=1 Tax=Polyodon spathula TaxID=7913 RepID=UPI001B7F4DB9|nr:28S ribosomal protein S23, mitochondrial isoform X2 [Polyodon spathula]
MAGSRLEKFGTVFTSSCISSLSLCYRVRDLMRAGVVKDADRPIWYDVYAAFPPKKEPVYQKPITRFGKVVDKVPEILYKEDTVRAKFYEVYGNGPRAFDLTKVNFVSTSQRFIEKHLELEKAGDLDEEKLFEETAKALLAEGVILRRRGGAGMALQSPGVSVSPEAESRDPVLEMRLKDMLQELQQEHREKQQTETPRDPAATQ